MCQIWQYIPLVKKNNTPTKIRRVFITLTLATFSDFQQQNISNITTVYKYTDLGMRE